TCPYEAQQQNLLRVWCRQSSAECCTGLTFSNSSQLADGGKLRVTQDLHSFTVELLEPSYTGGVYWCGLLSRNDTIIKLAEGYFHSSSAAFIWSFTRWMLLPLLPVATICAHVCTTSKLFLFLF
uniref:Si:ch211-102c2.4 n=1 Tax=Poecilia formosa TaxID=48698 RepID=A0A096LZC5_POEFO